MAESKIKTIVFFSTYPPRECGIATFTQDLLHAFNKCLPPSVRCRVAALNLNPLDTYKYPSEVNWQVAQNSSSDYRKLAAKINADPSILGVIIQHEYGIFGIGSGKNLLFFMKECQKPIISTLHTVLPKPNPEMKAVTEQIIKLSTHVIALTENSKNILKELYPEANGKLAVIPHGIHQIGFSDSAEAKFKLDLKKFTVLSTFGLLSQGKGIEYVIQALPRVIKKYPTVRYLVIGQTHPVVRRREGESYRMKLIQLIKSLGLKNHVKFYDQYLRLSQLLEFLKATDIYISSSIDPNQTVSGTLSYALGSGRAVISTQFGQAKEIITPDIGRLVPIKDSDALALALLDLLKDKQQLKLMHRRAYEATRPMIWESVAQRYLRLLKQNIIPAINLKHLKTMTDDFGIFQFANLTKPNRDYGYTLDDNARSLIVCSKLIKKSFSQDLLKLMAIYFNFIKKCQDKHGNFVNYLNYPERQPTQQNQTESLQEAGARAMWSLGEVMTNKVIPENFRRQAKKMFLLKIEKKQPKELFLRPTAYAIKAYALARNVLPGHRQLLDSYISHYADKLVAAIEQYSSKSWYWFEKTISYNNGILPEGLLIAGKITGKEIYQKTGLNALTFLAHKTFSANAYLPIGQSGWYQHKHRRSVYDQQPEDPSAMVLALTTAYGITHEPKYKVLALRCFSWFLGNNMLHQPLYDYQTGGCYDGLQPKQLNLNQGAESLLAYLLARLTIEET